MEEKEKIHIYAKDLRKNMTPEERHLWYDFLHSYPIRMLRQKPIDCYIADFYCPKAKLIIELDGGQHFEEEGKEKDKKRTEYLEERGFIVLRIPNNQVKQHFRGVCNYIDLTVKQLLAENEKQDGN